MRDVVICEPLRTPVGRYGGQFKDVPAQRLGSDLVRELLARTGLPPNRVDDAIFGQCYPSMEAPAVGRVIALDSGLSCEVPGLQLDRRCGSGLQAIINATMQVATGASELILAGGVESMSQAPFYSPSYRWGAHDGSMIFHDALVRGRMTAGGVNFPVPGGMLETAENLRREYSISREEQDEFAASSHRKAIAAQESGAFAEEIVPIVLKSKAGEKTIVRDEHPRAYLHQPCLKAGLG